MSPFNLILKSKFLASKNSDNVDIENDVSDELADDVDPQVFLEVENLQILGLFYCLGSKQEKSEYMYYLIKKGEQSEKVACYDRNLYRVFFKMVKVGTLFVEYYANPFSAEKSEAVLMQKADQLEKVFDKIFEAYLQVIWGEMAQVTKEVFSEKQQLDEAFCYLSARFLRA